MTMCCSTWPAMASTTHRLATLKEHEGHVPMNVGNIWRGEAGDRR
jgi:hypothetical protein